MSNLDVEPLLAAVGGGIRSHLSTRIGSNTETVMSNSNVDIELLLAAILGIAAHLLHFKHGERHAYPWRYVQALFASAFLVFTIKFYHGSGLSLLAATSSTLLLTAIYLSSLVSSVLIYRLLFNPLNRFPGPLAARISKLYVVWLNSQSNLHGHHELHKLHQKYGRYVRIGPNDLSVVDPDGMKVVLGPNSKCMKAPWYGQDMPYISTNTTRDRAAHDRRRRLLAPAFSDKALRGYAPRIQRYNDLLVNRIDEFAAAGKPMNVTKWFGFYGFDMMGDLVFNKSFNMLESGETHWAVKLLGEGLHLQGFAFPPWLYRVFATLPFLGAGYQRFVALAAQQLDDRNKQHGHTTDPDMMQPLIEHFEKLSPSAKREALPMLQGDSRMFIVAGSDTTSTTLIHVFYRLCTEKGLVERLRDELTPLVANIKQISYQEVHHVQLLHGCINETLRMHYPAPSGFFRKTPKEGVHIGDVYIPGDTVIQLPPYVMALGKSSTFIPGTHIIAFMTSR